MSAFQRRWQYANIDGEVQKRIVESPDQENPAVWKESPADLPPLPPLEPKLPECCQKLKAKFDSAWTKLKQEHADSQASLEGFDAQWKAKVEENTMLQGELDNLKTAHDGLKKLYGDLKSKHDALLAAANAEAAPDPTDVPAASPETPDTAAKPRARKPAK